jgi:hypothetical protein
MLRGSAGFTAHKMHDSHSHRSEYLMDLVFIALTLLLAVLTLGLAGLCARLLGGRR